MARLVEIKSMLRKSFMGVATLWFVHGVSALNEPVPFQTVALSGQAAPNGPAGTIIESFTQTSFLGTAFAGDSYIDDQGDVVFSAFASGPAFSGTPISNWTTTSGSLELVSYYGEPISGFGLGATSSGKTIFSFSGSGEFAGKLTLSGTTNGSVDAISVGYLNNLNIVAFDGGPAAGLNGNEYTSLNPPKLSRSGVLSFTGNSSNPTLPNSNVSALWSTIDGTLQPIIKRGDALPGYPVEYGFNWFDHLALNNAGDHLFVAVDSRFTSPTQTDGATFGIWRRSAGGALVKIAREGEPAPNAPGGGVFENLDVTPVINASGQAAFRAFVDGVGASIYKTMPGGGLAGIAFRGEQAPGFAAGTTFMGVGSPLITNQGLILFSSTINGPGTNNENKQALWLGDELGIELLFQGDATIPGVDPSLTISEWGDISVNRSGEMMLHLLLDGPAGHNSEVILFYRDAAGTLHQVLKTGDSFDVNNGVGPSDLRVIDDIVFGRVPGALIGDNGELGNRRALNDNGQFTAYLGFTDGSEAIITGVVPEPASLGLLAFAGLLCSARRRRY